jgi:predicted MFS family arabinose efflux permease
MGWVNIEILLPLVGHSFHANAGDLGLVLAGFPVGYAALAFPSGPAVLRWGHRTTLATGLSVMGIAGVLSAFAPNIGELTALRFLSGAGAGLFFAPSVGLLSEVLPIRFRPTVIGLFVSATVGVGGALGFAVGAILGPSYGWPLVLGLTGTLGIGMGGVSFAIVPRTLARPINLDLIPSRERLRKVLSSRSVWALTTGFAGVAMTAFVVIAFISAFVTTVHPGWGLSFAGLLGSIGVLTTVPGSLLGGWISERGPDRRAVGAIFSIAFGTLTLGIPFFNQLVILPVFAVGGFLLGVTIPILFVMPSYFPETAGGGSAVAVGIIETSQVVLQGGSAVAFGLLVVAFGYTPAWIVFGLVSIATLPALLWVTPNRGGKSVRVID